MNLAEHLAHLIDGRLDDGMVAMLAEGISPERFTDDDGEVDTDKLGEFVERILPTKGARDKGRAEARRRFGTASTGKVRGLTGRAAGRAEAARRFGTSTGNDAA